MHTKYQKLSLYFAMSLFCVLTFCSSSFALSRTALVIGNSKYIKNALPNPEADAKEVAKALERNGFNVILRLNGTQKEMEVSIDDFGQILSKGGVGLFFFAGHGLQVKGRNYLLPVDFDIKNETDVKYEGVDVGRILDRMDNAHNGLNIIILDACRDNPFSRGFRSLANNGLARMNAPRGSFVAYATSPGEVAADGDRGHSPYTAGILKYIDQPNMSIEEMFKRVRLHVLDSTGQKQIPWESSSLLGDFSFNESGKQHVVPQDESVALFQNKDTNRMVEQNAEPIVSPQTLTQVGETPAPDGSLYVKTVPEGARVRIMNIKPKFYNGIALSEGVYNLEISARGYRTTHRNIKVASGEEKVVRFQLQKAQKKKVVQQVQYQPTQQIRQVQPQTQPQVQPQQQKKHPLNPKKIFDGFIRDVKSIF